MSSNTDIHERWCRFKEFKDGGWDSWVSDYQEIVNWVQEVRRKLKQTPDEPFPPSFLERLILDKNNGISKSGRSHFTKSRFYRLSGSSEFCDVLRRLILNPTSACFRDFETAWRTHSGKGSDNPLLRNRCLAACTLRVSSTVDRRSFEKLYKWCCKEKIIKGKPLANDWFKKNEFLLGQLHRQLEHELNEEEKKDRAFILNTFVWWLYKYDMPKAKS